MPTIHRLEKVTGRVHISKDEWEVGAARDGVTESSSSTPAHRHTLSPTGNGGRCPIELLVPRCWKLERHPHNQSLHHHKPCAQQHAEGRGRGRGV
jgi:hypothetical protein